MTATWVGPTLVNVANISWTAPASDGGDPIIDYVVNVSPGLGEAIPGVDGTSIQLGGLTQGTTYTVTVQARTDIGLSEPSVAATVLIPTTPGAVSNITVEQPIPLGNQAVIGWTLPADDGGAPFTGFRVSIGSATQDVAADETTATFTGLPVGTLNATVQPINAAGDGPTSASPNFEVKAFAPFDNRTDFITQLYRDYLRRLPEAAGLAYWISQTNADGSNIEDIVKAFMGSTEFAPRRAVARLYFAYFNRRPDKAGFDYWTGLIAAKEVDLQTVSNLHASSEEFTKTYAQLTNGEFIVLVYNNVLRRRPEQAGFAYWLNLLDNGQLSRGEMMTNFSEGPEFVEASRPAVDVTVTYDGMLQRPADDAGFNFWNSQVSSSPNSLELLIREFYQSPEYAARVNN